MKATPKGNLPRAFVAAMYEAMQWSEHADRWHADRTVRNEEDVFPLHLLRILLELSGLIKRRKGFFSLTRAGERLSSDARAGELFTLLFVTHFRKFNLAYLDGVESLPSFQYTVAYALYRFGQVGVEWRPPLQLKADLVLPTVLDELPPGEYHDSWEIVLNNRLLRPLEGFALAEVRTLPRVAGEWRDRREYRKTPLFDGFLTFDVTKV